LAALFCCYWFTRKTEYLGQQYVVFRLWNCTVLKISIEF
jgi:hypothetical protein